MAKYAKVAIMQPTFLPWVGYFKMIEAVDVFVFLDDVQFKRRSWQSRNRYLRSDGVADWLSVSVVKSPQQSLLNQILLDTSTPWGKKIINKLKASYQNNARLLYLCNYLENLFSSHSLLCELNINFIKDVCKLAGIKTKLIKASSLLEKQHSKDEHLLDICCALGAKSYLSPLGSFSYLDENIYKFKASGIGVEYFTYEPKPYAQANAKSGFISHLSVIDLYLQNPLYLSSFAPTGGGKQPCDGGG